LWLQDIINLYTNFAYHAISLVSGGRESVLSNAEDGGSVVEGEQHVGRTERPVKPAWYGLPGPVTALVELLSERGVRVGFGENVAVAVLVPRMVQWVAVGGQFGRRTLPTSLLARPSCVQLPFCSSAFQIS